MAVVVACYVDWCTWSAENSYIEGHGRFWTRKTVNGVTKLMPTMSKEQAHRAFEMALQEELIVESTHEGKIRIFAMGESVIRGLPLRYRLTHIEKFLEWKAEQAEKAIEKLKDRNITVRVPQVEISPEGLN